MKKTIIFICFLLIALIFIPSVFAQTDTGFRGQSINGATGLFSIPSGRIGWDGPGNFAVDFGYRAVINNDAGAAHIPAITMSLVKWIELSAAFDFQPNLYNNQENNDLLLGMKIKLPTSANTSVAIGGNIQLLNIDNENHNYNAYQPYIAITYAGNFFTMPAETTIVFGKTLYSGRDNNSNVDFGMGFDLILFPDVFKNAVHWIIDFSNYGYSDNAWPNNSLYHTSAVWRGILNTGFRVDLSSIPALKKYKFLLDFIFNDLFDDGSRSFTIGATFGFSAQ
ncbi:MAG: hypothetical protein FWD22_06705 [Treponema sp.]|nr:hypothetical protein [Treponema sp.]